MDALLLYLLKMILCSGIMYGYYLLFLKDKTFHHYNRFYLLSTVIISCCLPLLKVAYFTMDINPQLFFLLQPTQDSLANTSSYVILIYRIFYLGFGLVSILLLARLIIGLFKIVKIKQAFSFNELKGIRFYQTNLEEAPFSYFKNLFWKDTIAMNSDVGQQILKHEMVHIEQKHTWDKLIMQIVKALFWMNPLFYIINKELSLIHEYLADHKAVKHKDTKAFARMLLESHFSGSTLPATSPFLSSHLKKRIKMLTQQRTKYSYARRIFALPLLFLISFVYLINAKNTEISATNKAIAVAVAHIQQDTLRVQSTDSLPHAITKAEENFEETQEQILRDQRMVTDINRKIEEKNAMITNLVKNNKKGSQEFLEAEKQRDFLGLQAENILNSPRFLNLTKRAEEQAKVLEDFYNSREWNLKIAEMEQRAAEIEAKINGSEFKKRIAEVEKKAAEVEAKVNTSEWKKKIADAEKKAADLEKKINSPEFKKKIEDALNSDKVIYLYNGNDYINASDGTKLNKVLFLNSDRSVANLKDSEKQVKALSIVQVKDLKGNGVQREIRLNVTGELSPRSTPLENIGTVDRPWIMNRSNEDTNRAKYQTLDYSGVVVDAVGTTAYVASDLRYFVNSKEVSQAEIHAINPKDIKLVNVNKFNNRGEIRIETK